MLRFHGYDEQSTSILCLNLLSEETLTGGITFIARGPDHGAVFRKRGRFARADQGTILLDEIDKMPLDAQMRLLCINQHRDYRSDSSELGRHGP